MLRSTLDVIAARASVKRAFANLAGLQREIAAFDGDKRGMNDALQKAEREIVQQTINAYRAWLAKGPKAAR